MGFDDESAASGSRGLPEDDTQVADENMMDEIAEKFRKDASTVDLDSSPEKDSSEVVSWLRLYIYIYIYIYIFIFIIIIYFTSIFACRLTEIYQSFFHSLSLSIYTYIYIYIYILNMRNILQSYVC